ncbi:hypothetical protein [Hymenobacter psychrophilus]|uniref:Uncharacterized protein n=1 Tax=Hymenobacter psychrophilus TaxID=651662 RepID=A0A1H3HNZ3_9BACT|nr:hypothetical protein [Hymenobacter psychrophilus]SDY16518.1 hypothetical protein SAMN04488069_10655 [Hymenobacter psychrophilus]
MKNAIRRVIILFIFAIAPLCGYAQTTPGGAADSATERRLIQQASADICQQLKLENQKNPLARLSQTEAEQLFGRLFLQAATRNAELAALLTSIGERRARAEGEQLGRRVGLLLMQECPMGQQLFMRLGGEQLNQQLGLRPEETKLLQPLAAAMCRDLSPRVTEMQQLAPAQRMALVTQALGSTMKPRAKQLNKFYGTSVFLDGEIEKLGSKIFALMAPQCPEVLILFADFDKVDQ